MIRFAMEIQKKSPIRLPKAMGFKWFVHFVAEHVRLLEDHKVPGDGCKKYGREIYFIQQEDLGDVRC
jgi:hypothetical protein